MTDHDHNHHQENIATVLSGEVERNINIATKLVPEDTFTIISREQFFKLIKLGVKIPLRSRTDILNEVDPQFVADYARLAKYTAEEIKSHTGGLLKRYPVAEQIMLTTWSFWFDYLAKLRKRLAEEEKKSGAKKESQTEHEHAAEHKSRVEKPNGQDATQSQRMMEDKETQQVVYTNDDKMQHDTRDIGLSRESLELVDDVWAEFEKTGMDKL